MHLVMPQAALELQMVHLALLVGGFGLLERIHERLGHILAAILLHHARGRQAKGVART